MALLADEFRTIILRHTIPVQTELINSLGDRFRSTCSYTDSDFSCYTEDWMNTKPDLNFVPTEAIDDLRRIAGWMIGAGYSRECVEEYANTQKNILNESFKKLGIEKLSSKTIQRLEWSLLDMNIRRWIGPAKIAVRFLFAGERRLSEQIFKDFGANIVDACFMEAVKDFATTLFDFMEAISSSRRSPEKLFRIVDLHQVLCDLLPDIQAIFGLKTGEFIRNQAVELSLSLSEAVRETLVEFEKALLGEPTENPVSGDVHPLIRYSMNYVKVMGDYKHQLEELIVSNPPVHPFSDISKFHRGTLSPFVLHLFSIIATLKFVLVDKSKAYGDDALAHLFLMNNVHFIAQRIKGSPILAEILGSHYLKHLSDEYSRAALIYQQLTWDNLLDCLSAGSLSFLYDVIKRGPRQRLNAFNKKFKKLLQTQVTWVVPDYQLCNELRISIIKKIIPVYTSFLEKYRSGKHPENGIKYSPRDIEKKINMLFRGY